jgi:anti-sigma factor RsiW
MDCRDLKNWIASKDLFDERVFTDAEKHLEHCEKCRRIHTMDTLIEDGIKIGLQPVAVPRGLLNRVETELFADTEERAWSLARWFKFVPALAVAALIVIIVLQPFSGQIKSLDQMGTYALANHLSVETNMAVSTTEAGVAARWFTQQLGYAVKVPDLRSYGLTLLGGRLCSLGEEKAAYLLCRKNGKKVSLFIVTADALGFHLVDQRIYGIQEKEHDIKIWKDGKLVRVTVEQSV